MVGVVLPIAAALWVHTGRAVLEHVWDEPAQDMPCAASTERPEGASDVSKMQPAVDMGPREVVIAQMEALQRDDTATAFAFASPANRAYTGPLERFDSMVRNSVYSPMLRHRDVHYGQVRVAESTALVPIVVLTPDWDAIRYEFVLERQIQGPYKGMWMTSSVVRYAHPAR
ncbi:MAG: DUF4864 domain-containing protein, partial [Myxococcota bacterium]